MRFTGSALDTFQAMAGVGDFCFVILASSVILLLLFFQLVSLFDRHNFIQLHYFYSSS